MRPLVWIGMSSSCIPVTPLQALTFPSEQLIKSSCWWFRAVQQADTKKNTVTSNGPTERTGVYSVKMTFVCLFLSRNLFSFFPYIFRVTSLFIWMSQQASSVLCAVSLFWLVSVYIYSDILIILSVLSGPGVSPNLPLDRAHSCQGKRTLATVLFLTHTIKSQTKLQIPCLAFPSTQHNPHQGQTAN